MIYSQPPSDWKELQARVAQILTDCGCTTEVENEIKTVRGSVEIDVHALVPVRGQVLLYLCECKFWNKRVEKATVHAFRTVVHDSGAHVGYLISKEGFQSGAYEAAEGANVQLLSWDEFEKLWLEEWKKCRYGKSLPLYDELFEYTDYFHRRTTEVLHAIPERVKELAQLWKRYHFVASLNSYSLFYSAQKFPPNLPYKITFESKDGSTSTIQFNDYMSLLDFLDAKAREGIEEFEAFVARYTEK